MSAPDNVRISVERFGVVLACAFAAACLAFFASRAVSWIEVPADIIIWAESAFVGDIIKLQTGVPLYTPPEFSNSMIYTPGAPWLTWLIVRLAGVEVTVPAMRWVQAGFIALAAVLVLWATLLLRRLAGSGRPPGGSILWTVLSGLLLTLALTAPEVNRNVLRLHNDALALLLSMMFWLALILFVTRPGWGRLAVLAVLPAVGFATKQFLLAWLPVTAIVVLLAPWQRPAQRWQGTVMYLAAASLLVVATIAVFRAWWGDAFTFWAFDVMGGERRRITIAGEFNIAIVRSIDHLLRGWWALAIGAVGGWLVLQRNPDQRLVALFSGWMALIGVEVLVSGAGWNTLYHFGPGVVMGTSWLLAGMTTDVPFGWSGSPSSPGRVAGMAFLRSAALVTSVVAVCMALRVVPTRDPREDRYFPAVRPTAELGDHVRAIEAEFEGLSPDEVLLDVGNWVYLRTGHLARDRAISLADQPPGGHYENFEPLLQRVRQQAYRKILVHDFHDPHFLYDWYQWHRPSGVRDALMAHYEEVRVIPGVSGIPLQHVGPVSVLVPRTDP